MAKKSIAAREVKREKTVLRFSNKRDQIKSDLAVEYAKADMDYDKVETLLTKLNKMPRNASKSRLQNRCGKCARPRGVWRRFGLCRCCLRLHLMNGDVSGGRKSSW